MSIDVEDFKSAYLRLCKEHHVDAEDSLVRKIAEAQQVAAGGGSYSLNLSTQSISVKTCGVLAKLLATSNPFVDIKFNDCSLPDEGVRALAYGLASNTSCKRLDLKGNSIRGPAAESLGRILQQNVKLRCVTLEWNDLGLIENAFSVFCDGVGANSTLLTLDLRSNQISHVGAGELANALKRNSTLQTLDLRWNNIGLVGGRALLAALDHNKTLTRLLLAGNNVPADVLRSIDTAVARNADRAALTSEYQTRQHMMSHELQQLNKSHRTEIGQLLDKVDRQEALMQHASRSASERICRLQEALDERRQQFNKMATKLSMAESELTLSDSKVNELDRALLLMKEAEKDSTKLHKAELARAHEERSVLEARLNKALLEASENNAALTNKVDELERKCRLQHEQIFSLKESLAHQQAEVKLKQTQFEELVQFERQKVKDACRDAENVKAKELERLHKEMEESERVLKERLQRADSQRLELEDELSRCKLNLANERLVTDDQLTSAKQRIRTEEEQRRAAVEEKLQVAQTSRDELQSFATQQSGLVAELQSRNSQLSIDNETLRRRVTDLQQELAGKNAEMLEEVARVRLNLNARIEQLENDCRSNRVSMLEKELSDAASRHRIALEEHNSEVQRLTETIKQRDAKIHTMREADAQRVAALQSAVHSYVTRSPYSA